MKEVRKLIMTENEKKTLREMAKFCAERSTCSDCLLYELCYEEDTTLEGRITTILHKTEE